MHGKNQMTDSRPAVKPRGAAPTNADRLWRQQQCLGELCPWCILSARHGSLIDAARRADSITSHLGPGSSEFAGRILNHAVRWCMDICHDVGDAPCSSPPGFGPCPGGTSMAVSSSSSTMRPSPGRQQSILVPPPPPPPPRATDSCSRPSTTLHAGPDGAQQPTLDQWGIPLSGFLTEQWNFECWTGKSQGWVAYPESDQIRLRELYNGQGGITTVHVGEVRLEVQATYGDLWQNNPDTEAPRRRVRVAPVGGWPE